MADTKRQTIVDALEARLETIQTPTYNTNAGTNVKIWLDRAFAITEMPAINIRDTDEATIHTHGLDYHDLRVELDLFAAAGDAPRTMRGLIGDVITAIATDDTFGGLAVRTIQNEEIFQLEQNENVVAGVQLVFTIEYETGHHNPYT